MVKNLDVFWLISFCSITYLKKCLDILDFLCCYPFKNIFTFAYHVTRTLHDVFSVMKTLIAYSTEAYWEKPVCHKIFVLVFPWNVT